MRTGRHRLAKTLGMICGAAALVAAENSGAAEASQSREIHRYVRSYNYPHGFINNTERIPWQQSHLLSGESTPPLPDVRTRHMVRSENRLAIASDQGIATYRFEDGRWQADLLVPVDKPVEEMIWRDDRLWLIAGGAIGRLSSAGVQEIELVFPDDQGEDIRNIGLIPHSDDLLLIRKNQAFRWNPSQSHARQISELVLDGQALQIVSDVHESKMYLVARDGLRVWDVGREKMNLMRDAQGSMIRFEAGLRTASLHPEGRWLWVGTHGAGFYVLDMQEKRVSRYHRKEHPWMPSDHVWQVAMDTQRDVLYLPAWNRVVALWPASDPERWEVQGYLHSFLEPAPLHTYKDVAPTSGMVYLSESDQLLFGDIWGVTVLSSDRATSFVQDEGFDARYDFNSSTIQGEGPAYAFIRENKLRAIWTHVSRVDREGLLNLKHSGINTLFYNIYYVGHDEFYSVRPNLKDHLAEMGQFCDELGMQLVIAIRPYGRSASNWSGIADYEYDRFVMNSGEIGRYLHPSRHAGHIRDEYPCLMDGGYWERSIFSHVRQLAEWSREFPLHGILYELGDGFSGVNFRVDRHACVCDNCWKRFLDHRGIQEPEVAGITAREGRRYQWIVEKDLKVAYWQHQEDRLATLAGEARGIIHRINPDIGMYVCLPETDADYENRWFFAGWMRGFGTPEKPAFLMSQQTYGMPFTPSAFRDPLPRMQQRGIHGILIPGLVVMWHTPEQLRERAETMHRASPGMWYYAGDYWWDRYRETDFYRPRYRWNESHYTLDDYLQAMSRFVYK